MLAQQSSRKASIMRLNDTLIQRRSDDQKERQMTAKIILKISRFWRVALP